MEKITASELYSLYVDTLTRCTTGNRLSSDEEIAYNLFEEFDSGAQSFLHESSLRRLRDTGYIDEEIMHESMAIREEWFELTKRSWDISEIRRDSRWHRLFSMCDKVLTDLGIAG